MAALFSSAALVGITGCGGGGASPGSAGASGGDLPIGAQTAAAGTSTAASPAPAPATAGAPSAAAVAAAPATAATPSPAAAPVSVALSVSTPAAPAPLLADCEMFPSTAIFNTRIDDTARFPVHGSSGGWIASIGASLPLHADWWTNDNPADASAYFGLPVNVVDGTAATTDWPVVSFDFSSSGAGTQQGYPHESDCAAAGGSGFGIARGCSTLGSGQRRFPFPVDGKLRNEGGSCNDPAQCGDHHVLVVEQGACRLWESFAGYKLGGQWYAMSTAAWDLKSLALRPANWTSADAAGLPITPLLVRAAEASSGEIRHALRVTLRDNVVARSFDWPARHASGNDTPGGVPFGALLRLKSGFAIPADWTPQAKAIATAAKRYGMYVADIGMDFYVQGEPSASWDTRTFSQLKAIPLSQMEFVDKKSVTGDARFSPDSMAASW